MADDWVRLTALAEGVLSGDARLWDELWQLLQPILESWIGRFFAHGSDPSGHTHDVLGEAWVALGQDDHRRLRRFFTSDKARELFQTGGECARAEYFQAWLRRVVLHDAVDYKRRIPEYIRQRSPARPAPLDDASQKARSARRWREIEQITTGKAAITGGITRKALASRLLQFLDDAAAPGAATATALPTVPGVSRKPDTSKQAGKPARSDRQLYGPAIRLWCAGYSDREIADELGLSSPRHARRIVKAAKELLRRHFRDKSLLGPSS